MQNALAETVSMIVSGAKDKTRRSLCVVGFATRQTRCNNLFLNFPHGIVICLEFYSCKNSFYDDLGMLYKHVFRVSLDYNFERKIFNLWGRPPVFFYLFK
jgi:hypothetical protein